MTLSDGALDMRDILRTMLATGTYTDQAVSSLLGLPHRLPFSHPKNGPIVVTQQLLKYNRNADIRLIQGPEDTLSAWIETDGAVDAISASYRNPGLAATDALLGFIAAQAWAKESVLEDSGDDAFFASIDVSEA